jgi:hypothetical protein
MALITVQRAIDQVPNFDSDHYQIMADIVDACSGMLEKYLNRTFAVTTYDELYDGSGHRNLLLNNFPVTTLTRVMSAPIQVLNLTNNKTTVSRASFRLDATNLYLTAVDSGVEYNRTISRSSCTTLADLATAVNAYSGEGWTCSALGNYSGLLTADLFAPQGGSEIRFTYSYLYHHIRGVPGLMHNPTLGEITSFVPFVRGYQNFRVIYSAGYATIPEEIQQAVAEIASSVYQNMATNPNLQSENLGGYSYSNIAEKSFANLSISSKFAIEQYRNRRIVPYRVY